ncbi:hypothetical protein [Rosettibacter firmus]|uniref:hypothetical protein n=1 Tax=Rosettibacter firmus TaxID=3111522 RepID=UPI00336C3056
MKKFLVAIIAVYLLLISSGCNNKNEEQSKFTYSIFLAEFKTLTKAYNYRNKLDKNLIDSITIRNISPDRYLILYGKYNSSFDAGYRAYDLFKKGLIKNYKIYYKDEYVKDLFANVLFIANYSGRPSIYNFNLVNKQTRPLWTRWGRKVLTLNYSKNKTEAFIITAKNYNVRNSIPYINDIGLLYYDGLKGEFQEVYTFGDGIQIYSYWETEDTFKVNITFSDSLKPEILIQKIYSFDITGILTNIQQRYFNLQKDGFPKPPKIKPVVISPKGRFQIRNIKEIEKEYIYLRDVIHNSEILIFESKGELKSIKWTDDEKYCMIIAADDITNNSGKIIIVDTNKMQIRNIYKGPLNQNLLVHGNFLFFEEEIGTTKQITIYDFNTNSIYYRIQFYDGCGLNNL